VTDSAQGIDVSSYQPVLTSAALDGLAFAFAKATDGPGTDPRFAANWPAMKERGIHRGAYHELWSPGSSPASVQAAHFLSVVRAAGLERGDMLAVSASDYPGVTGAEVKAWCDIVHAAEPECPVLVYSDLSALPSLSACTDYPLWVAHPSDDAPADVRPWGTWRFWQWGANEVAGTATDRDAFNGTASALQGWLDSASGTAPAPPAPKVTQAQARADIAQLQEFVDEG
jgi:lysozyme